MGDGVNSRVSVELVNCGGGGGGGIWPNALPLLDGGISLVNDGRGETLLLPAKGKEGGERGDDDISICLLISRAARAFRLLSSN